MRITYDITREPGSRVNEVLIRDTNNPTGGFRELNVNQSYQIGMPSFISSGAGRFSFMKEIQRQTFHNISEGLVLKDFLSSIDTLSCGIERRIEFTVEPPAPPAVNITGTVFCKYQSLILLPIINNVDMNLALISLTQ